MAFLQPSTYVFVLLVLINPAFALSETQSLKIGLGVCIAVIGVLLLAIVIYLIIRRRHLLEKRHVLGQTYHPRFGDIAISAPAKGWSHLSPIRAHYPRNARRDPSHNPAHFDPEAGGVSDLKHPKLSPSSSTPSTSPSVPAPTYNRTLPPAQTIANIQPNPAPVKPFILATDLSSKRYRNGGSPSTSRPQQSVKDEFSKSKTADDTTSPQSASEPASNLQITTTRRNASRSRSPSRTIRHQTPSESPSRSATTNTSSTAVPPSAPALPAAQPQQPAVLLKPASESYMNSLSLMSRQHENHYGYPSSTNNPSNSNSNSNPTTTTTTNPAIAALHRFSYRAHGNSRQRSRERSTTYQLPRHPAHERRTSDNPPANESETANESKNSKKHILGHNGAGGGGGGYSSDYENRGRWGMKGKKQAVEEEDLYG